MPRDLAPALQLPLCVSDPVASPEALIRDRDQRWAMVACSPTLIESALLQRVFRLRQRTRTVRQYGQMRLHYFGLSIDRGLWGQNVEVLIDDEAWRIEQAAHFLVSYPCVYDTVPRRITTIDRWSRSAAIASSSNPAIGARVRRTDALRLADAPYQRGR